MTNINDALFSPGEYLKDELEARGWTQEAFAHILGRPYKTVNQILNGTKSITPQTAQELAAALGTSAELWMNLESAYRLSLESEEQGEIVRRAKLYETAPVKDMIRRNWIKDYEDVNELEKAVEKYFSTPLTAAARKSTTHITPAQRAWIYRANHLAKTITVDPYKKEKAVKLLDELHALTTSEHEVRRIPKILANMGIRFLLIEHLPKTKIDGATIWLDDESPIIVLSMRYDRIDGFWHTLSHELSHVLNGDKFSIDNNLIDSDKIGTEEQDEDEIRADLEASNFLIPQNIIDSFIARHYPRFSKLNIIRFANLHQIHPGIVVGQLQHKKAIKYSHSREMLVPIRKELDDVTLSDGWGHYPII
jgi:HTH-type transcriptional regulator / antitoxin HigA